LTEISVEGRCFFDGLTSLGMWQRNWKGFQRMASRNVSITLQSLAEVCSFTRELFWRSCSLNDCAVLYFSEMKWFQEHFKATVYNFLKTNTMIQRPAWCSSPVCLTLTSCCVAILLHSCWYTLTFSSIMHFRLTALGQMWTLGRDLGPISITSYHVLIILPRL
jgi:hypothetical protein